MKPMIRDQLDVALFLAGNKSKTWLADQMGVHRNTIHRRAKAKYVHTKAIAEIAARLGYTMDEFMKLKRSDVAVAAAGVACCSEE